MPAELGPRSARLQFPRRRPRSTSGLEEPVERAVNGQESVGACGHKDKSGAILRSQQRSGGLANSFVHGRAPRSTIGSPLSEGLARCVSLHADLEGPVKGRAPNPNQACQNVHQGCDAIIRKGPHAVTRARGPRASRRAGGPACSTWSWYRLSAQPGGGKKNAHRGSYARPTHSARPKFRRGH